MAAEPRPRDALDEALELDYLDKVLEQLARRASDCELLLAELEPPSTDVGDGRLLRAQAHAAVLRARLARVRHASALVESYIQLCRDELARRHDPDNRKTTTTMEVP